MKEKCKTSPLCSHNTNDRDLDKPCSIEFKGPESVAELGEMIIRTVSTTDGRIFEEKITKKEIKVNELWSKN